MKPWASKPAVDGGWRDTGERPREVVPGSGKPDVPAIRPHTTLRGAANSTRGSAGQGNPSGAATGGLEPSQGKARRECLRAAGHVFVVGGLFVARRLGPRTPPSRSGRR